MIKLSFFFYLLCGLPLLLSGQTQNLVYKADYPYHFQVVSDAGQASIEPLEGSVFDQAAPAGELQVFDIQSVELDRAHLLIKFNLKKPFRGIDTDFRVYDIRILTEDGLELQPSYALEGDVGTQKAGKEKVIRWLDVLEYDLDFQQNYTLFLSLEMTSDFDCNEDPRFDFDKQAVHYFGLVMGGAFLLAGDVSRKAADDHYAQYQQIWQSGGNDADARVFLADAKGREEDAQFLTYAGLGIIAVDVLWFFYRKNLADRKKKIYRYCQDGLSVRPYYQPSGSLTATPSAVLGARFSLRF